MKSSSALALIPVIPNGGRYARLRSGTARDLTGVPSENLQTFEITKRIPSINCNPRWRLTCSLCGNTRDEYTSTLLRTIDGTRPMSECSCSGGRLLDATRCQQVLGMHVSHVETLLAVMAHERVGGEPPFRIDVEATLGRTIDSKTLVRRRYLEQFGSAKKDRSSKLRATEKAWREFGFERTVAENL